MSAKQVSDVFAALGDATRFGLVIRLAAKGPASITALAAGTNVSRQAITKHLHVLSSAGVAAEQRRGRESLWQIEPAALQRARTQLDRVSQQWDRSLERLRSFVETD